MKTAFVSDTTLGLTPQEALQQEIHLLPALIMMDGKGPTATTWRSSLQRLSRRFRLANT